MRRLTRILLSVLASLTLSCQREAVDLSPSRGDASVEGRQVEILISIPADEMPATRALGEDGPDEPMQTLHLAVFGSSGYLKEYVKATPVQILDEKYHYLDLDNIPRDVDQYTFRAQLTLADSRRTIHFIGNGPSTISFGYQDAIVPNILSENGRRSYWQMRELPKISANKSSSSYTDAHGVAVQPGDYIDADGNKITNGTGYVADAATMAYFQHIPLIRNWAKIVVRKDESLDPSTNLPNDPFFEPISYAVVNVPSRGTVAPHCAATGFIRDYDTKSFQDLKDMGYTANLPAGTIFDDDIPSEDDFKVKGRNPRVSFVSDEDHAVYLYERPVPSDKIPTSSVIIYGTYKNPDPAESEYYGKNYFYKVDLMEKGESGEYTYYPICRNFKYQIMIYKIRSHGHYSPAAAVAAAGSADVSADINTSSLNDISDGQARLVVRDWMAKTFTDPQTLNVELSAYFMTDVQNNVVDIDENSVTLELIPRPYNAPDIITDYHIHEPVTDEGDDGYGWRSIHFSTVEPGMTIASQTLRVTGHYTLNDLPHRLYRDIVITIQPIQPMKVHCDHAKVPYLKGSPQSVTVSIPDGLVESMFPLQFQVEADKMTLTPDNDQPNNNLPVEEGESLSGSGKRSFHFVRTLSWNEYQTLALSRDEEDFSWRSFTCYFKTNRDESASTVWVTNRYFHTDSDAFINFVDDDYRSLGFSSSIPRAEDAPVSIDLQLREDVGCTYPDDFPTVSFEVSGMTPVSDFVGYDNTTHKYVFQPSAAQVTLEFMTTTKDGDIRISFEADGYQPRTLRSHYFSDFKFVDAHELKSGGNSNVVLGWINRDANKNLLFQYYEDPDAPDVPVWLKNPSGLVCNKPEASAYPAVGLSNGNNAYSRLFKELDLKTPGSVSGDLISFYLCANGYVEEYVYARRFQGSFLTKTYGYSGLGPSNTSFSITMDNQHTCNVSFSEISAVNSSDPKGIILNAGGTYTIQFELSGDATPKMYYVEFKMRNNTKWNGVSRDLFPKNVTVSAGTYLRWGGNKTDFMWHLPADTRSATITMDAQDDCPICIYQIRVNTYRASFY